jgi:hypothetical protein
VVTASGIILGEKYKSLINKFDRMRRKYQNFMVEAGSMVSDTRQDRRSGTPRSSAAW